MASPGSPPAPARPAALLSGVAAVLLASLACVGPGDPQADIPTAGTLLITGGTVITMDAKDSIIENGAVVVVEGRIAAIGPAAELDRAYPNARRVDAAGKIVMPGLINAHTHVPMVLFRGLADDLVLMEWLDEHIFPAEARLVDEEFVRWGTRLACMEMLRGGITTFVDMYYFEDVVAQEAERCGMRAVVGETLIDFPAPDNTTWDEAVTYSREFVETWRGHSRITPAIAPHAPYTVSGDHLVEAHALATELDVPLLIHLAEDRAELETISQLSGMTSVDYLDSLGVLDDRVLAAHVVWPTQSEIELLAERGVGVAHCPQSNMKIAAGVAPAPAMIEAGVALGLGTDGAASNNDLNLWEEIDTAAKLHKVTTGDPTVIDAREALRMATIEGARALGMESEIGSLEVGKRADLIVVGTGGLHQRPSYSPYSLLTYTTKASDVETVIVEGRIVVDAQQITTLDSAEVLERVEGYRRQMATDG